MSVTRRRVLLVAAGTTAALAGCTNGDGGDGQPAADDTDGVVTMANTAFEPVRTAVDTGTTVEWVNEDDFDHDVTATQFHDAAADWDVDADVPAGERVTHTFEESGVYQFYCSVHGEGSMCGAVLVGDASLDAAMPCEDSSGGGGGGGGMY